MSCTSMGTEEEETIFLAAPNSLFRVRRKNSKDSKSYGEERKGTSEASAERVIS